MKAVWNLVVAIFNWMFDGYMRPGAGTWKCCLFIPHKLYDVGGTPIWPGNRGVDSLMGVVADAAENQPWQAAKRTNWFKWAKSYGGDTWYIIAELLFNNSTLQQFFTSEKGEFIQEARKYGIKRGVVGVFNDGPLPPADIREAHIKRLCEFYNAWASVHEIAFLTCLESEKNMTPAVAVDICNAIKRYAGGKRILVGTPKMDFHRAVHRIIQAQNAKSENKDNQLVIGYWKETDWFPFNTTMHNAPNYLNQLVELKSLGDDVWAGEHGAGGSGEVDKWITEKAIALKMDCGSGYYK